MKHRDRVRLALEHKEPDRIPIDMNSVGSLLVDSLYFKVKNLLKIEGDILPYRSGSTANYYDERIMEAFDIDFRHIWFSSPDKPKSIKNPDGTVIDEWGITWSKAGSYPSVFPLRDADISQLLKHPFPLPDKKWDISGLKSRAEYLHNQTDFAIVAKGVLAGGGILERAYYLRTIEELFMDMQSNKKFAFHLLEKIVETEIAYWDIYLDAVGGYVDIIQRASDLGTQQGLFISPKLYREFLKPYEKQVISFIKTKAPNVKIWFHSCGAIKELIDDFLDIGVDVLNPVQPLAAGMDSFELKKQYGSKLCFHGGIDLQKAMIGSLDDVKKEVETRITAFAPGGGYILAPANHIQADVSAENVVFLYKHAKEFGKYPIGGK